MPTLNCVASPIDLPHVTIAQVCTAAAKCGNGFAALGSLRAACKSALVSVYGQGDGDKSSHTKPRHL